MCVFKSDVSPFVHGSQYLHLIHRNRHRHRHRHRHRQRHRYKHDSNTTHDKERDRDTDTHESACAIEGVCIHDVCLVHCVFLRAPVLERERAQMDAWRDQGHLWKVCVHARENTRA